MSGCPDVQECSKSKNWKQSKCHLKGDYAMELPEPGVQYCFRRELEPSQARKFVGPTGEKAERLSDPWEGGGHRHIC